MTVKYGKYFNFSCLQGGNITPPVVLSGGGGGSGPPLAETLPVHNKHKLLTQRWLDVDQRGPTSNQRWVYVYWDKASV